MPDAMMQDSQTPQASPDEPQPYTHCRDCSGTLDGPFYTSNGEPLCGACYTKVHQRLFGGGGFGRAIKACALGLVAGLVGGTLWFIVRRVSGYELGLIALLMGLLVGLAVRKGSNARGGWFYQAMAIVLTYGCICVQYVPDIVESFIAEMSEESALVTEMEGEAADAEPVAAGEAEALGNEAAASLTAGEDDAAPSGGMMILALGLFLVIAILFSLALPILAGFENFFGLIIIAIALYEAWKINQKETVHLAGPFKPGTIPPPMPVPVQA